MSVGYLWILLHWSREAGRTLACMMMIVEETTKVIIGILKEYEDRLTSAVLTDADGSM